MKFQVFKAGKVADKLDLSGAYLFGSDGIAIRGAEIRFDKGFIECNKSNLQTAGLALHWPVEGTERVFLSTTCLPERQKPYNLNVEIARGKLMQIMNKREDWSLFNAGIDKKTQNARKLFIRAIQEIADMPGSSRLADEALKSAAVFSEGLAVKQAEAMFGARVISRGFGKGCLGCGVEPAFLSRPEYIEKLLSLFGSAMLPVNWAAIEKEKGQYDFSELDRCVDILSRKRVTIAAGPLLCFDEQQLPRWLTAGHAGFEKVRESAYKFVNETVERYAGKIRSWSVISGINNLNWFGFSFEQALEMTRAACMAAKAADEKARKIIEIQNPWGEYYAVTDRTIPPLVYIDMVVQSGINFDGFALKMSFGDNHEAVYSRDMIQISALLDTLAPIAKPFWITNVDCVESRQKRWLENFYKIALSKPFVEAVVYSRLLGSDTVSSGGLLNEKFEPKEAFGSIKKLQEEISSK